MNFGVRILEEALDNGGGGSPAPAADVVNILAGDLGGDPAVPAVDAMAPPAAAQAPVANPLAGAPAGNWKDVLPLELRDDPSLKTISNVDDLAKSYLHARKQIGADKIVMPSKHATDQEWREVYQKLGLPQSIEEYSLNSPQGSQFQDGFITEMKKIAFESGVLPHQMETLLNKYSELNNDALAQHEVEVKNQMTQNLEGLKQEWGNAYEARLRDAKKAYKFFGQDPAVKSFLEDMGSDSDFVRLLSKIGGQFLKEDSMIADGVDNTALAPGDAGTQLSQIYSNQKHPYWDKTHPNHQAAVKEVKQLNNMAYPKQQVQG